MRALEAFVGTVGIALVGWLTIPLAAAVAGVDISTGQALTMSAVFFIGRFLWLLAVRCVFHSRGRR